MSRLLRDVLCVIETFHKYAREAGDEATLTFTELKRLIQGELGDVLQPHAILAVERNLNLPDTHSNSTISFDEFVLTIFNLLNICDLNIQSLLKSEARQMSKPEEKPSGMDLQVTSGPGQWTEHTPPTQDRVVPPSGMALSAQLRSKKREHNGVDPQGNTNTYKLLGEASKHNDSKNQHLKRDQQSQETAQDVPAPGDSGAQLERNKPRAQLEQIGGPTKGKGQDDSPREGDKPVREQNGTKTRNQFGEQEGNLKTQSDLSEKTPRPSKDQEVAAEKVIKEHSETQELSLSGKDEPSSEHADLPGQAAAQKPLQTEEPAELEGDDRTSETQEQGEDADGTPPEPKNPAEPREDGRTSETQEPPAQGKEHETKKLPVQGDSRDVSETSDVRAVSKERRGSEAHRTAGEKENERKVQLPTPEEQQDAKYQELQESSKERLEEASKIKGLSSQEGNQNHPEIERAVTSDEATHAEKGMAEALMSIKNATVAEEIPGARERTQELELLKNQSGEENKRVTKTHDKPVKEDDGYLGKDPQATRTQNNESSPETPNSLAPEDGDSSSETTNLPGQEDAQSQVDTLRESVERNHNNNPDTGKQVALDGERRTQEAMVPAVGGNRQLTKELEWASREEHKSQGSGTKSPGPAVHPDGHPEAQESTTSGENRKLLETEIPGTLDIGFPDQLSIRQLLTKEDSSKPLKVQGPSTKGEEGGTPETQEAWVNSLDEDNSASSKTQPERKEPATLEDNEIPQESAGEANDPQNPAKKGYDASVPQPGLEEKMQMDQEPRFVERGAVYASPLYQYLQEKLLQQMDMTEVEQQNQAQSARASSPDRPIFFSDSQTLHSTREHLPGADPADVQQTSAPQASEDKQDHCQGESPVLQSEASTKKQ